MTEPHVFIAAVVHLLMPREGTACGAKPGMLAPQADINRVTCPECIKYHDSLEEDAMNAADVIGYSFAGAIYCLDHLPDNPPECTCDPGALDEHGLCQENCHGYGPTPVFGDGDGPGSVCDVCFQRLEDTV